eukprot:snap_masked-scaffold_14-processed-gene-3.35-mRNA-1 protein AED:1.00 eAED:1.00 QI:0/-1/0/0/-1/1/1/0/312
MFSQFEIKEAATVKRSTKKRKLNAENNKYLVPPLPLALKLGELDPDPHTLILGTCPSEKSLARGLTGNDKKLRGGSGQQMFGNPRNCFFNIAGSAFNFSRVHVTYQQQLEMLTGNGYALWEVFYQCIRKGSLDNSVDLNGKIILNNKRGENKKFPNDVTVLNDIPWILRTFPSIRRIVLPGSTAEIFAKTNVFGNILLKSDLFYIDETRFWFHKAKKLFLKKSFKVKAGTGDIELICLPSTSPASAALRPYDKEKIWFKECFSINEPPTNYLCVACNQKGSHFLSDCSSLGAWKEKIKTRKHSEVNYNNWYI